MEQQTAQQKKKKNTTPVESSSFLVLNLRTDGLRGDHSRLNVIWLLLDSKGPINSRSNRKFMCLTTFRSSQLSFFLAQAPIQLTMLVLNKFSHCLINVPSLNENMAYFKKKTLYIISFPQSAPLLKWVLGGQIVLFPLWINYCIKYQRLAFT